MGVEGTLSSSSNASESSSSILVTARQTSATSAKSSNVNVDFNRANRSALPASLSYDSTA